MFSNNVYSQKNKSKGEINKLRYRLKHDFIHLFLDLKHPFFNYDIIKNHDRANTKFNFSSDNTIDTWPAFLQLQIIQQTEKP